MAWQFKVGGSLQGKITLLAATEKPGQGTNSILSHYLTTLAHAQASTAPPIAQECDGPHVKLASHYHALT
jgi:hypothetical protein